MNRVQRMVRLTAVVLCELLAVWTIVWMFVKDRTFALPLAFCTPLIILIPSAVEWMFRCRFNMPAYVFAVLYAIGPMLGQCHGFYHKISEWDKLLHIAGGVAFAIFGLFLYQKLGGEHHRFWLAALFALCLSMAVAVGWEIFEFASDRLTGSDMQGDTVIEGFRSYLLDGGADPIGGIGPIRQVVVDGTPLPVGGYIDIGLLDTMWDMIVETAGALPVALWHLLDRGRHPIIIRAETD